MSGKIDEYRSTIDTARAERVIKALSNRNIEGVYCAGAREAVEEICRRIPPGALVGLGGSESIIESGLVDALRALDIRLLDRYRVGLSKDEIDDMRRRGLTADVFIASTNALTEDGRLVNIDGTGNRVAAMIYGPAKVILMVGMNKLAPTLEAALSRVKNTAAPLNAVRVKIPTPCAATGFCQDPACRPPNRICAYSVITEASLLPDRLTVVLVGEPLGF
jgi:hypothetical protein